MYIMILQHINILYVHTHIYIIYSYMFYIYIFNYHQNMTKKHIFGFSEPTFMLPLRLLIFTGESNYLKKDYAWPILSNTRSTHFACIYLPFCIF